MCVGLDGIAYRMDEFAALVSYRIVLLKYITTKLSEEPDDDAEKKFYYNIVLTKFHTKARQAKDLICGNALVVFAKLFGPTWLYNYRPPPSSPNEKNLQKVAHAMDSVVDSDSKVNSFVKIMKLAASKAMRFNIPTVFLEHVCCKTANMYEKTKAKAKKKTGTIAQSNNDEDEIHLDKKFKENVTNTVWLVPKQSIFSFYKKPGHIRVMKLRRDGTTDRKTTINQSVLYSMWSEALNPITADQERHLKQLLMSVPMSDINVPHICYNVDKNGEKKAIGQQKFTNVFKQKATNLKKAFLYGTTSGKIGFKYNDKFVGTKKENPCRELVHHLSKYYPKFDRSHLRKIKVDVYVDADGVRRDSFAARYEAVKNVVIPNFRANEDSKHKNPNPKKVKPEKQINYNKEPPTVDTDGVEVIEALSSPIRKR